MITKDYYRFIKSYFKNSTRIKIHGAFLLVIAAFTMNACSTDSTKELNIKSCLQKTTISYTYNSSELETMDLINSYRSSIGLNTLERNSYISHKSEEHDNYMITNKAISHNDFVARSENIIKVLGVTAVGENIAYNFQSPKSVVAAWLNSPQHKKNIEGDYAYFGISIRINSEDVKYYTIIFAK